MRTLVLPWFGSAVLALVGCELPPTMPPAAPSPPAPPNRAIDAGSSADKKSDVDFPQMIDPREWFAAHGAKQPLDEYDSSGGCSEIVVGAARDPALLCTFVEDVSRGHDDSAVYRVATHQIVRLV